MTWVSFFLFLAGLQEVHVGMECFLLHHTEAALPPGTRPYFWTDQAAESVTRSSVTTPTSASRLLPMWSSQTCVREVLSVMVASPTSISVEMRLATWPFLARKKLSEPSPFMIFSTEGKQSTSWSSSDVRIPHKNTSMSHSTECKSYLLSWILISIGVARSSIVKSKSLGE